MKRLQEPKYTGYIARNNFQKGTDPTIISKMPLLNTALEDLQKRSNKSGKFQKTKSKTKSGSKSVKTEPKYAAQKPNFCIKSPIFSILYRCLTKLSLHEACQKKKSNSLHNHHTELV